MLEDKSFPVIFSPKIDLNKDIAISPVKYAEPLQRAVKFASTMDKRYPSLYFQLELGHNWEEVFLKLGKLQ